MLGTYIDMRDAAGTCVKAPAALQLADNPKHAGICTWELLCEREILNVQLDWRILMSASRMRGQA